MREFQEHNVLTRDDTFFGICEAIGEDFGISPFFLRLALGMTLVWSPLVAFAAYGALGLVVGLSRLIAPNPRRAAQASVEAALPPATNDAAARELAVAA